VRTKASNDMAPEFMSTCREIPHVSNNAKVECSRLVGLGMMFTFLAYGTLAPPTMGYAPHCSKDLGIFLNLGSTQFLPDR
jgi:hypothetical protein